jgi:hypothetical protein
MAESICQKKTVVKNYDGFGSIKTIGCTSKATYEINGIPMCRHHARKGRYVVRDGDVGEIKARFDTEQELRDNIHLYPGMRMQMVTRSHRRDIYKKV